MVGKLVRALIRYLVPILFLAICTAGILIARLPLKYLVEEMVIRTARNSFLVLSLIIPVIAGMGLNFGIVLGAMAGQVGLLIVTHYQIPGIGGFLLATIVALPLAILLGQLTGRLLNKAKGTEMITGMIFAFFANGIYQLVFLFMVGSIIPMRNEEIILPGRVGIRDTVDLRLIRNALDNALIVRLFDIKIPMATLVAIALLCLLIRFLSRTKLGQDLRAVGQDLQVAQVMGIDVDKIRITAIILSTILAGWGQLIFLQNIGTLNTYSSHEQVGMFAIAALLVGGASVSRATIWQALLGTVLFHILFVVSPLAGQALAGDAQIGEFFRVFVAYGIIAVTLGLHAWQRRMRR